MINLSPLIRKLRQLLDVSAAFWCVFILFLNLPIFIDFMADTVNAPKFYIATYPIALLYALLRPRQAIKFLSHPLILWVLLYVFVIASGAIRIYLTNESEESFLYGIDQIQRLSMLPVIAFILWQCSLSISSFFFPLTALIVCIGSLVDFSQPGLMAPAGWPIGSGRAEGFYINANAGAEAIMLTVILARNHLPKLLFILLYALAGFAIAVTFSRSGMTIWFLTAILLFVSGRLPKMFLLVPIIALVIVNTFTPQIEDAIRAFPEYENKAERMLNRLTFFQDKGFSGDIVSQTEEDSRTEVAINALVSALDSPILGHGVDYIEPGWDIRAHNLIISLFHQYGVLGLLVWFSLFFVLWSSEKKIGGLFKYGSIFFVFFSFFSHNILENVYWYVFFCAIIYIENRSGNKYQRIDSVEGTFILDLNKRKRRRRKKRSKHHQPRRFVS